MSTTSTKTTITTRVYQQLLGLEVLAARHIRMLGEIEEAVAEVLGVPRDEFGVFGHVSDFVWAGEPDVNDLLRKLDVRVEKEAL